MKSSRPSREVTRSAKNHEIKMRKPAKKIETSTNTPSVKIVPTIDRVDLIKNARLRNIVKSKMIRYDRRNHINLTNRFVDPEEDAFNDNHPMYEEPEYECDDFAMFSNMYDEYPEVNYMTFEEIPV